MEDSNESKKEPFIVLDDSELYKYKYIIQKKINAQIKLDMYRVETERAAKEFAAHNEELTYFLRTIEDKYNLSKNKYQIDSAGGIVNTNA